jgi:hypothetical protein
MSYLQKYVRQLKPRNESYTPPVDKIQNFLTESDTETATRMEQAIVVGYNIHKNMSEDEALKQAGISSEEWKKAKTILGTSGIKQGADIASQLTAGKHMVHTGRGKDKPTNYYGANKPKGLGYDAGNITPKTDIAGDSSDHTFSVKQAGGSFLASPAAGEASGMVASAILNYEKNEQAKVNTAISDFLTFLEEEFDELRYKGVLIEAGAGKKDFLNWYLTVSDRRADLSKKEKNKKKQDDHMKAELSVFKIPANMAKWEEKIIKGIKPITKDELNKTYIPTYVADEYQINTGDHLTGKAGKRGGQINPDYFTANDKEVAKDNSALKSQIVTILDRTIAQNEAHEKFEDVFTNDEGFKKYLVYEAASGAYKFTGKLTAGNYSGSEMAVAKKMLSFSGSVPTVYDDIFSWAGNNTGLISTVSFDFKGSGKGRYTALKMDYEPFSDSTFYSIALDKIMEEEWTNMQEILQEGLRDWVAARWRDGKDAISKMVDTVKDIYQKYVAGVVTKFLGVIKEAATKGIKNLFDFLGIELTASVSFGTM